MANKPVILLYDLNGIGLIIPWPSGVVYQNQVGGYSCQQMQEEGVFVPLENGVRQLHEELHAYFTGPKWDGWCDRHIDDETAEFVDSVLARMHDHEFIKVDRSRLTDSMEAWIHLDVQEEHDLTGLTPCKAILTWPNSD